MTSFTFCLWEGWRSSPKGDDSGLSNARRASVRSSSDKISGFSSPRSASWVWANSSAASTFFSLINSINCCCCKLWDCCLVIIISVIIILVININISNNYDISNYNIYDELYVLNCKHWSFPSCSHTDLHRDFSRTT